MQETSQSMVQAVLSMLTWPIPQQATNAALDVEQTQLQLVAKAALERQMEAFNFNTKQVDLDGVPMELARHLLELHFNRQHHSYLLTYRPAFMRDMFCDGPYFSKLLLVAIFASASKYSDRMEVRTNPDDPKTAGQAYFNRAEQLLTAELKHSSIPTLVALLLLGSTLVSTGNPSSGWLYSGMAFRMVFDLGLHLDPVQVGRLQHLTIENMEIRRRVFWGAFVCDKLQSLYLGRPVMIRQGDTNVSKELYDTYEENEFWVPLMDGLPLNSNFRGAPTKSVTAFVNLCSLTEILSQILVRFYAVNTPSNVDTEHLEDLNLFDQHLNDWVSKLPADINFAPWNESTISPPASTVFSLLTTFYVIKILLHRPFVADGHLRKADRRVAEESWQICTEAAIKITSLLQCYQQCFTLRRTPYQVSYALYVASTVHVRNAAQTPDTYTHNLHLDFCIKAFDEVTVANPGFSKPANIIKSLMRRLHIPEAREADDSSPVHLGNSLSLKL